MHIIITLVHPQSIKVINHRICWLMESKKIFVSCLYNKKEIRALIYNAGLLMSFLGWNGL